MNNDNYWENKLNSDEKLITVFSIGKGYINFMLVVTFLLCALIFSLCFIVSRFIQDSSAIVIWFGVIVSVIIYIGFIIYYKFYLKVSYQYALTSERVMIKEGWLQTKLTSIDYQTLTDVKVVETFTDKLFTKTASILLNTAGADATEGELKYVQNPYEIKKQIYQLAEERNIKINQSFGSNNKNIATN